MKKIIKKFGLIPQLIPRIIKSYILYSKYFKGRHIVRKIHVKISPYELINPFEFFDYYAVFYAWCSRKLEKKTYKILDVGGVKIANAILSRDYDITSVVLRDPLDTFTNIKYVICDVGSDKLPFEDNFFDVLLCPATLHLIGLGRYGDNLNPYAILNFISEINRVLKQNNSHVFLAVPVGKNALIFNTHYIFDFKTYINLFEGWILEDYFLDEWSGVPGIISSQDAKSLGIKFHSDNIIPSNSRFSKDIDKINTSLKIGEYKLLFLHLRR